MSTRQDDLLATIYAVLRVEPNNSALHNQLGCIFYKRGQLDKAIEAFNKAIRLSPDSWEAHFNLGNSYVKKDLLEQSISHYLATLKLNPEHAGAQVNLAMVYVSQKNYLDALPWLELAAKREPNFAELQGQLAECYLDLGKTTPAIDQFNLALKLEPNRTEWLHNLAILYLREQDHANALKYFAATLQLDPNNKTARHMLNALQAKSVDNAPLEYIRDLFDQYAAYYNKHMTEALEYHVPAQLRQAVGNVIPTTKTELSLLDLGCGTGLCGLYFRDLAYYMVGVDLSTAMLKQAKRTGAYDGLCCGDIRQTIPGFAQHIFDVAIAADVLVYLGDLDSIFFNVRSILKVNGIFAFSVENSVGSAPYSLQKSGRFAHTQSYIYALAKSYGFTLISTDYLILRKNAGMAIEGTIFVLQAS